MCQVLSVSTSGYYAWLKRLPSVRQLRRDDLEIAVKGAHEDSHRIYGYRKVHEDVIEEYDMNCCAETVRRIMQEKGLWAKTKRKFVITTDSRHRFPVAENLLDRDFQPSEPNQKWAADITYIGTQEGWLYLAVVMDLYGRRIVGWATSEAIDTQLVSEALDKAVQRRCPGPGLLHHSDRGSQYASEAFQDLLELYGIECSMSRKGNCWDNACVERFFGSLKSEWLDNTVWPDRATATGAVFEYIEMFYNTKRRHASLDYKTPAQFEAGTRKLGKQAA